MTTTPQEKALLDAAVELELSYINADAEDISSPRRVVSIPSVQSAGFDLARRNYLATLTPPRECRPPDNKPGLYWLVREDGTRAVGEWMTHHWWTTRWRGPVGSEKLTTEGWTVHGPCIFPGTGGEATEIPVKLAVVRKTAGGPVLIVAGIEVHSWFGTSADHTAIGLAEEINAGFSERYGTHFRAPKLKISDEEIDDIARESKWYKRRGFPYLNELPELIRAVIDKASEGES